MEEKRLLTEMGNRVREFRKQLKLSQTSFYQALYPEEINSEVNIKRKMYSIEHGELGRLNMDFLLRMHDRFGVSLDYVLGYETEYPNYDNKAASEYVGLSAEAVEQLHFWSINRKKEVPKLPEEHTEKQRKEYTAALTRQNESKWILEIVSKLLEKKSKEDEKTGIADLSIFYDLYMMTLEAPDTVTGIDAEVAFSDVSYMEKLANTVRVASDTISYKDQMGEIHLIKLNDINQQVWKNRLMRDIDDFVAMVVKKHQRKNK